MPYSQNSEEGHILANAPDSGRFLDIGAFDARKYSNTRALYERGWDGVMVEPSPGPLRSLLAEYGNNERITVISAAVGTERGIFPLRVSDDAYSTSDEASYRKWRDEGGFYGRVFVPHITIEDLINQFGEFHFVSIDAEGNSMNLLHALLATEMFPPCVCCEHDGRMVEAANLGESRGYKTVHLNDTNIVLAR